MTPTGPSVGVSYRRTPKGETSVVTPTPVGVARKIAKSTAYQQEGTLSPDTLRREQARPERPTTPEEAEYASRPAQVSYHGPQAEMEYAEERRSRGVRGARRSGARQRGEPVLTDAEKRAIGIQQDILDEETSAARDAEIRKPGRRSRAFYGSRPEGGGAFGRIMSKLQFYQFDPVLGQAFEALNEGELGEARALLRGFSGQLAGADPRRRKKFFRLFRNVENAPPEVLEKHAALQSLFSTIAQEEATLRVGRTEAAVKAFRGQRKEQPEAWDELLDAQKQAKIWQMDILRGVRRREGGGRVEGPLQRRLRVAREAREKEYLLGEKRPELFIGDSGRMEIVGEDGPEIRTFPESGKVEPRVPEWIRRGMAKDLTRREGGGGVQSSGFLRRKGLFVSSDVAAEETAFKRTGLSIQGTGVQRVYVVNMPAGGFGGFQSSPAGANRAAGPGTSAPPDWVRDLLRKTAPVEPREPKPETIKPAKPDALSAEERVNAMLEARFGTGPLSLRERASQRGAALSETTAFSPVRSLAPSIGQIVGTLFGRGELLKRLAAAREASNLADKATAAAVGEEQKLLGLRKQLEKTEDPEAKRELTERIEDQTLAWKAAHDEALKFNDAADKQAKHADALSLKLRTLAGNTVGIIGGTLLFGATLGAAQLALTGIGQAVGPVVERMTGFTATSARVTGQLGQQIKAQDGASESAFALIAAQSGIGKATADAIGPLLQQRATIEEGNRTLQQGLDILHTYEAARRAGGQQGLFGTTSGFQGTILGGVMSTQELIKKELNAPEAQLGSSSPGAQQEAARLRGIRDNLQRTGGYRSDQAISSLNNQIVELEGTADVLNDRIEFFNDALDRGGSKLKFMAGATDETAAAFASAAEKAGLTEIAATARGRNKVVLVDEGGNPVFGRDALVGALEAINTAQTQIDPEVLIKQLTERIIPAARSQFAAQARFQRQTLNPAQFALQSLAEPTPGTGGVPFEAGLVGRGDTTGAKAAANYKAQVGGAVDFVNAQIAKGREQLVNLVPANLRGEFTSLLGDIAKTGQQISRIQLGVQQQQVNLQVAEYNNQLRIARRSLKDAKDLQAGINGEQRNTLGGIEGQNIALQRQLQLLQFELQQRQINFRLATAGFVAPGTTPEERAARIEFAKQEAAFAQKQLDIQKQLAANQFRGVQITADRNVTDLVAQISLLQQGKQVTVNTAAASRALDVLNKKQALLVQQAGTYIEEGVKITQAAIEAAVEVQRQTGKGFSYILSKTAEAWGIFGDQARLILNGLVRTAPSNGGFGPKGDQQKYAAGVVGDTLGPTEITIGEAAGEKVAILKNPKLVPSSALGLSAAGGMGGPTIQMTVVVTGNSINKDMDLTDLAERIGEKVERRLMQKTSLFGLRRV